MRIALNAVGEVGLRTGRILGAESDLVALGIYGDDPGLGQDRRTIGISTLDGYDVLVTDDVDEASAVAAIAAADGVGFVTPGEIDATVANAFTSSPLLTGCSLAGLAETLSVHEATRTEEPIDAVIAWTEEGKPLRRGTPVAFPDPVGARWGEQIGPAGRTTRIAVPLDGQWAGATATIVGRIGDETQTRIVGVADDRAHLEALALAAGAVVVAQTERVGHLIPGDLAEEYLLASLRMGLGVATYTME